MPVHLIIRCGCFLLWWQTSLVATEMTESAKWKIFTLWPFTEKVCQPMLWSKKGFEPCKFLGQFSSGSRSQCIASPATMIPQATKGPSGLRGYWGPEVKAELWDHKILGKCLQRHQPQFRDPTLAPTFLTNCGTWSVILGTSALGLWTQGHLSYQPL